MPLAVDAYREIGQLADGADILNLAWTLDERALLAVDLQQKLTEWIWNAGEHGIGQLDRYLVNDPYGEESLSASVAHFFGHTAPSWILTAGAGVGSLLYSLAGLSRATVAHVLGYAYMDYPFWIERLHGRCLHHAPGRDVEFYSRQMESHGASSVFLERPAFIGDDFTDLSDVAELCARGTKSNTIVIVDESNANYCPPEFSAAHLLCDVTNLIVLRGFSKAYGLGGLRLGFCLASRGLQERVRALVPPLLASSLSLYLGSKILGLGDIAGPLRDGIVRNKAEMQHLIESASVSEVVLPSRPLPYILMDVNHESLKRAGIIGKKHLVWCGSSSTLKAFYRYSVPISAQRMEALRQKLSGLRA